MPEAEENEKSQNNTRWYALLGGAVAVLALGLILGLLLRDDSSPSPASVPATVADPPTKPPNDVSIPTMQPVSGGGNGNPPQGSPTPPPPSCLPSGFTSQPLGSPVHCSNGVRREDLYLAYLRQITGQNILEDTSTPQGMAYAFIINYDTMFAKSCNVAGLVNRYALMTFYFATSGDMWTNNQGWCGGSPHCSWTGVTCSNNVVTGLDLESNNLVGSIPQEIYALNKLQTINLFANSLAGTIPNMKLMSDLRMIDFQQNLLTGPAVPLTLPVGLTSYRVSGNRLSGTIPPSIDNWKRLRELWAGHNSLSGTIPTEMGNLVNLKSLYLYENNMKGSLPTELGKIPMEEIWLSNNFFETQIPEEFLFLGSLKLFRFENNLFTGSIATWIGLLTNLQDLRVNSNNLQGTIPAELGLLTDLVDLRIGNNFWNGNLPNIFNNLSHLKTFEMSDTVLGGNIPSSLFLLPSIEHVDMSKTQLEGTIPTSFGNSLSIETFQINDSPRVVGPVPPAESGGLRNLEELLVQGTNIRGSIPSTICSLRRSSRLDTLEADCNGSNPTVPCNGADKRHEKKEGRDGVHFVVLSKTGGVE
eukprot:scaffold3267_cov140-Cylindrotheca_fusiformis.AAC.19